MKMVYFFIPRRLYGRHVLVASVIPRASTASDTGKLFKNLNNCSTNFRHIHSPPSKSNYTKKEKKKKMRRIFYFFRNFLLEIFFY